MPRLMTRNQFADFMQVSTSTVDAWRRLGLVRSMKTRNRVYFARNDVLDFLCRHQEREFLQ